MRALFLLTLLLLPALPVWAQNSTKKKPVFDVDEDKPDKQEASPDDLRPDPLKNTLMRLAGWPSERSRRAAERLIVQKEKSLPLVLDALVSQDPRSESLKPGAAYVLGRIGSKTHFLTLLLVAAEKKQQKHADTYMEAAYRLDPAGAVTESFRFFYLSETTLRREAVKFVRNHITRDNLEDVLTLLDRRKAERAFTREIGLVLLDRLYETGQIKWLEPAAAEGGIEGGAGPVFYKTLGDESPQVASRAVRLVASHSDQPNLDALNELITKEASFWRQRAYATMALSVISSAFKVQPFTPEAIEVLRGEKGLYHRREMLVQAASALGLAHVALRTGEEDLVRLLDRQIPIVLIESVGAGNRHYRDFASVVDLSYAMLRRITGQNLPDQAPAWSTWWRDHGSRFRARRELLRVEKGDIPDTIIEWFPPRSTKVKPIRFTVVGALRPTFLHGTALAVTGEQMQALVDLLVARDFFDEPEADPRNVPAGEAVITLRVGDLNRTVSYGDDEEEVDFRNLVRERLLGMARDLGWQLWQDLDQQPSWELFFAENNRWFSENTDPQVRDARLREMVAAAIDNILDTQDRVRAVRFVAFLPGAGKALSGKEAEAFVRVVAREQVVSEFTREAVDLLVPDAGENVAVGLVNALADRVGPDAHTLLVHLCGSLTKKRVAELTSDTRWKVRRAAVTALGEMDREFARPVLLARLSDEEVPVRLAAAEELARMKDASILPSLAALRADRSSEVRAAAAYAYGLLGSKQGRQGIADLLYRDPSPRVRNAAIDGLVEGQAPEVIPLLLGVFRTESDIRVRAAAASGIVSLETPQLVDSLIERLQLTGSGSPERVALVNILARFQSTRTLPLLRSILRGDDTSSADAAALGLARRWDAGAISQLIRMVERGRNARTAVRHLQLLTSREFEATDYTRQAENYKGWFATNSTGNPRVWFRDALLERGFDISSMRSYAAESGTGTPIVPLDMAPMLLTVLRAKEVYLISNASMLLNRIMENDGATPPKRITHRSRPDEAEASIDAYHDWWADRTAAIKAKERG